MSSQLEITTCKIHNKMQYKLPYLLQKKNEQHTCRDPQAVTISSIHPKQWAGVISLHVDIFQSNGELKELCLLPTPGDVHFGF